jgi:hypothetical protein
MADADFTETDPQIDAIDSLEAPPTKKEMQSKPRFKDVRLAYNAYKELRLGDKESAINRIRYQMQLDGAPPYSPAELTSRGLATIANVNFGFMEEALTAACAPYEDLIEAADHLVTMPTLYGNDEGQRLDWQNIMEKHYTNMTLNSEGFDYQYSELCRQFILHGPAIPYFEGPRGINYRTTEMGNFLLERDIAASEKAITLACAVREYMPYELFEMIGNHKVATENGWNVKQTWKMIKAANPHVDYEDDLELMETQWKNNDLGNTYAGKPKTIRVVHMWAKAVSGKIEHMMFDAAGQCEDFMYRCPDKFEKMSHALIVFTNGVGTNGKYHGIRGLGYKIYAIVKEMNEIWSSFLDAIRMVSKIAIQPADAAAMKNLALVEFGHFLVIPPKAVIQPFQFPNYGQNMIPALQMLQGQLNNKSAQYTSEAAFNNTKEQTRTEILARLDQISKLSISQLNIFYKAWTRLHRERIRRLITIQWNPQDPDYEEVQEFFKACERDGVPKEAWKQIDLANVRAIKAIGAGSAAARTAIFDRLLTLAPQFDAEGQHNLYRDAVRTMVGKTAADRYIPAKPGQRPPVDKKIADLENIGLSSGSIVEVEPNEMHAVHIVQHLTGPQGLLQDLEAFLAGQVGYEVIPSMRLKHTHTEEHMQFLPENMPNGTPNMQKASFKQALQQTDEQIWNGEKHLQAEQQKAQEDEMAMAAEQNQISPTESRAGEQAMEALQKVELEAEAADLRLEQELRHGEAKFEQEMKHEAVRQDHKLAGQIREEILKTRVQPNGAKPKQ